MQNHPESTYRYLQEKARRLAEESAAARQATAVRGEHSRGGLLALYLRRLADRIDPTGVERSRTRLKNEREPSRFPPTPSRESAGTREDARSSLSGVSMAFLAMLGSDQRQSCGPGELGRPVIT